MTEQQINQLLELIDLAVSEGGTWKEKRDAILEAAGENGKINLGEFAAWFEES